MTHVTTEALASVDTASMETKTQRPILEAVSRQHAEDDQRRGVDPYNTARHRALRLRTTNTEEQQREAEQILACYERELRL